MASEFLVRRTRDARLVIDRLRNLEPATTQILGAVEERRLRRGQRAWLIEGSEAPGAVLVVDRICFDRWLAWPVLFDLRAAPVVAELVDASRAWLLEGVAAHVEPCVEFLTRIRGEPEFDPFFEGSVLVDQADRANVDKRTRVAEPADLDRVLDLYREWELAIIPTVPRLRRHLRDRIEHGPMIVLEIRGRVVAATYVGARSDRFLVWTGLTVEPEYRGRGVGARLFPLGALITKRAGCQAAMVWSTTNEMRVKPRRVERMIGDYEIAEWAIVNLGAPKRRFRGERRARALIERLEGPVRRRPLPRSVPTADPGSAATSGS
jgi:N-acetylglutamate synthase-like GNAT family acetyltransferase